MTTGRRDVMSPAGERLSSSDASVGCRPGSRRAMADTQIPDLAEGEVIRAGRWTVAATSSGPKAVSSRCRHQLADLSRGSLDSGGCLVCPWHGARYDPDSGRMLRGPRGFLGYRGPTPGYTALIAAVGRVLPLRRRSVVRIGDGLYLRKR